MSLQLVTSLIRECSRCSRDRPGADDDPTACLSPWRWRSRPPRGAAEAARTTGRWRWRSSTPQAIWCISKDGCDANPAASRWRSTKHAQPLFKRPTKVLQDALAAGGEGLRVLALHGAVPVEGGLPLVLDGKFIGAIGVSGGTSPQDGQCAKAGADAVK